MFGQPNVDSKIRNWLELLGQADPETRRGELMVRNLLEDANVCPALQQQLRDFVAAEPAAGIPDQAAEQFQRFLQETRQPDPPGFGRFRPVRPGAIHGDLRIRC